MKIIPMKKINKDRQKEGTSLNQTNGLIIPLQLRNRAICRSCHFSMVANLSCRRYVARMKNFRFKPYPSSCNCCLPASALPHISFTSVVKENGKPKELNTFIYVQTGFW
ncbi:hypothetical protein ACOSQ2_009121 [Xanthoceras sorbifolium]